MSREVFQIPFGSTKKLTSGINRLTESLKSVTKDMDRVSDDLAEEFQDLVIATFIGIKDGTPVDTGEAQAGWELKRDFVKNVSLKFEISNSVKHIGLLEFGRPSGRDHSLKRPKGMVRTNLLEFEQKLKTIGKGIR